MATKDWVKSKQYTNVWFKGDTQKSISVKSGYDSMYHDDKYYAIYDWGKKELLKHSLLWTKHYHSQKLT